jgi:hypothetical protein
MKKFKLTWQHFLFCILIIAILGALVNYLYFNEDNINIETLQNMDNTDNKFPKNYFKGSPADDPAYLKVLMLVEKIKTVQVYYGFHNCIKMQEIKLKKREIIEKVHLIYVTNHYRILLDLNQKWEMQ